MFLHMHPAVDEFGDTSGKCFIPEVWAELYQIGKQAAPQKLYRADELDAVLPACTIIAVEA